jgi:DNA-directed RNA polymerase specialized sigma24 family protein
VLEGTATCSEPASGLDALLHALGGATAYLRLRAKLVACLERRGGASPDDLADETLDRVQAQLADGEPVRDPTRYAFGVARRVAMEASRRWRREHGASELEPDAAVTAPIDDTRDLSRALAQLDDGDRALLARYGELEGRGRVAARKALAAELGIGVNALRIRVHRARKRLRAALTSARR